VAKVELLTTARKNYFAMLSEYFLQNFIAIKLQCI